MTGGVGEQIRAVYARERFRKAVQQQAIPFWAWVKEAREQEEEVELSEPLETWGGRIPVWRQQFPALTEQDLESILQTELFALAPSAWPELIFSVLRRHGNASSLQFCRQALPGWDEEGEEEEEETEEQDEASGEEAQQASEEVCQGLHRLHLLILCEPILYQVCSVQVESLIHTHFRCEGESFEVRRLAQVQQWMDEYALPWLQHMLGPLQETPSYQALFCSLRTRLAFYAHEVFAKLRIQELFDIIIDFPESTPALEDLRECLIKTNQLDYLVHSLTAAFKKRLLHPGANTTDIIVQFVNTVKALRVLDSCIPSMDALSRPIREYLRKRSDTIRCAVTMFTDENSDLYQELMDDGLLDADTSSSHQEWKPSPIHSLSPSGPPTEEERRHRDLFAHFISIFGSKELFINEYRSMLADRLLQSTDFTVEKETRVVELLKLRFGESSLKECEIMIKDISTSKRMNKLVHEERHASTLLQPMVISHLFWPTLRESALQVPPPVAQALESYQEGFRAIKRDRKIEWKADQGSVVLEVELHGQLQEMTVTPVQATLLFHFQQQAEWDLATLSETVGLEEDLVRRRLGFWTSQGIIEKGPESGTYRVREEETESTTGPVLEEEDVDEHASRVQEEQAAMWMLGFNFISACLTNQGPMGADRLHFMLSTLMGEEYRATPADLRTFLEQKIKDDILEKEDGLYRMKE